jgi:hypothetical protein
VLYIYGVFVTYIWYIYAAIIFYSGEIFADAGMQNQDLGAMLFNLVQFVVTFAMCPVTGAANVTI